MTKYETYKISWDVFQFIVTLAIGVYAWWLSRNRVTTTAIVAVKEEGKAGRAVLHRRVDDNSEAILKITGDVEHRTAVCDEKTNAFNGMSIQLGEMNGSVEKLTGTVEGVNRSLDIILEHLLDGKK